MACVMQAMLLGSTIWSPGVSFENVSFPHFGGGCPDLRSDHVDCSVCVGGVATGEGIVSAVAFDRVEGGAYCAHPSLCVPGNTAAQSQNCVSPHSPQSARCPQIVRKSPSFGQFHPTIHNLENGTKKRLTTKINRCQPPIFATSCCDITRINMRPNRSQSAHSPQQLRQPDSRAVHQRRRSPSREVFCRLPQVAVDVQGNRC